MDWKKTNIGHKQGLYPKTNQEGTSFSSRGTEYAEIKIDLSLASHDKISIYCFVKVRAGEEFPKSVYDNEF